MYKNEQKTTEDMIVDLLLSIMESKVDKILEIAGEINTNIKNS